MPGKLKIGSPIQPCPLSRATIVICVEDTTPAKAGVEKALIDLAPVKTMRLTNADGLVTLHDQTANLDYTATVSLPGDLQKRYRLLQSTTASGRPLPGERLFLFLKVLKLCRPKFRIFCSDTNDNIGMAKVSVAGTDFALSDPVSGLAQLADTQTGLDQGQYTPVVTLDAAVTGRYALITPAPSFNLPNGCDATFDIPVRAKGDLLVVVRTASGKMIGARASCTVTGPAAFTQALSTAEDAPNKSERKEHKGLVVGDYKVKLDNLDALLKAANCAGLDANAAIHRDVAITPHASSTVEFVLGTARPKIRLLRSDNNKPVVKAKVSLGGVHDLGLTNDQGIAELPAEHPGIGAGEFEVRVEFDAQDKSYLTTVAATPKVKIEFGKDDPPLDVLCKATGSLELILRRCDNTALKARANWQLSGPTAKSTLATAAEIVDTVHQDRLLVEHLDPGVYSVQIDQLQTLLDAQKDPLKPKERWRIGPDKTGKAVNITIKAAETSQVEFTLTRYQKIQFIAFNVKPGVSGSSGVTSYLGGQNASEDIGKHCLVMKEAMKTAFAQGGVVNDEEVLKVFMAPEFYYRGAEGGYPVEYVDSIMEQMRTEAAQAKYKDWLFCYGTAIGYLKQQTDYPLDTAGNKGNLTTLRVTGKAGLAPQTGSWVVEFLGAVANSQGIFPTHTVKVTGSSNFGPDGYDLALAGNAVEAKAGKAVLSKLSDETEIFNVAFVQKGGPAGSGTGLRESIIYKEYVSPIDYLGPNFGDGAVFHTNPGRKIDIHGERRTVLPTVGSVDRLAKSTNPTNRHSEITSTGLGGGSVFLVDGITFGLEVCLDHAKQKLKQFYANDAKPGDPKIQVQLIPSWGMSITPTSITGVPGVLLFNVDGPAGANAGGAGDPGKFYCPAHPSDVYTAAGACTKDDFFECKDPGCWGTFLNAPGICPGCGKSVGSVYYCPGPHIYTTPTCPVCKQPATPAGSGNYTCTNSHSQSPPGPCVCGKPLSSATFCRHPPRATSAINCPNCGKKMAAGHHALQPYKSNTQPASSTVPDPAPNQPVPVINTTRASAATVPVTAKQSAMFERTGSIQVFPVMDVPEAEIV